MDINIYDQPLEPCGEPNMSRGSWDPQNLRCNETGGGVHQICVQDITNNLPHFSEATGQSDWSAHRGSDNHCVCLGAWALYSTQNHDIGEDPLKCDAIPRVALTDRYAERFSQGWTRWNGLEVPDQIRDGVESLFTTCYDPENPYSANLLRNYCTFAQNHHALNSTPVYEFYCSDLPFSWISGNHGQGLR